jgi:DNA-binding response OmpR family regulator
MEERRDLLVVDDDPDILRVMEANLDLHGFHAIPAESFAKAKEVLNARLPDLILLDIMLPDGDGREICKELKKQYPSMPVIMLTARDSVSDKVIGFECGADDYIVKPFETLELIARIKACLRRATPSGGRTTIGNLEVDMSARTVKVRGNEIELTAKEYDLLQLFLSHRGEAISREIIRKKIWGDSKLYSWSRTIDVHIQHLRQKIEDNPSRPEYILTVPGIGYKFKK